MGISQKQITDYETDRVNMNAEMVVRFAATLKVSTDILLGLKDYDFQKENNNLRFTKRFRELNNFLNQENALSLKSWMSLLV